MSPEKKEMMAMKFWGLVKCFGYLISSALPPSPLHFNAIIESLQIPS